MAIGRSLIVGVSGMWQGLDHLGRECRRAVKFREMDFRGISHVISIIEDCFLKKNWQIGHWGWKLPTRHINKSNGRKQKETKVVSHRAIAPVPTTGVRLEKSQCCLVSGFLKDWIRRPQQGGRQCQCWQRFQSEWSRDEKEFLASYGIKCAQWCPKKCSQLKPGSMRPQGPFVVGKE